MRIALLFLLLLTYTGLSAQWVSVGPKEVKKLCKEKIRIFELEEIDETSKKLNAIIKDYFTKDWKLCEAQFIPHQDDNPEYEKEGFHILFYFQFHKADKKKNIEKDSYSLHLNFNNCKPSDKDKEHYNKSLVSYDLWRDIPVTGDINQEETRESVLKYTYDIGLQNKLTLTLHCFENLLTDMMEMRKSDLNLVADANMKNKNFPIIVFNSGDLPKSLKEEKDFKKFTDKKVLVVEPQFFKNSKQGFVEVGVVLIYPYRNPDATDTISVYEINSGKLIGRFTTVLDKAGTITKKEVIQILDSMQVQA